MKDSVARAGKDTGSRSILSSGATTVITNNDQTAFYTSPNSKGRTVVAPSTTVFVENKGIARESDGMSDGGVVDTGSTNVFAGK
jgi:uncharacterized Zn-binding protein involved in type VI secretion